MEGFPRDSEVGVGSPGAVLQDREQAWSFGPSSLLPSCVTLTAPGLRFFMGKMRRLDHLVIGNPSQFAFMGYSDLKAAHLLRKLAFK